MTVIDKRGKGAKDLTEKGELVGELGSSLRDEIFGGLPRSPEEVGLGFFEGQLPLLKNGAPEEGYR